jgi:hypothetical protein
MAKFYTSDATFYNLEVSGSARITGSITVTDSIYAPNFYVTSSNSVSASIAATASYINVTGSGVQINWNGSQLQLTASVGGGSGAGFPFTGSAQITGSLGVTGSVIATTGSFGHIILNGSPISVTSGSGTTTPIYARQTLSGNINGIGGSRTSPTTIFNLAIPSAGTWRILPNIRAYCPANTAVQYALYITGSGIARGNFIAETETMLGGAGSDEQQTVSNVWYVTTTGSASYAVGGWGGGNVLSITDGSGYSTLAYERMDNAFQFSMLSGSFSTLNVSGSLNISGNLNVGGTVTNVITKVSQYVAAGVDVTSTDGLLRARISSVGNNSVQLSVPTGTLSVSTMAQTWYSAGPTPNASGVITLSTTPQIAAGTGTWQLLSAGDVEFVYVATSDGSTYYKVSASRPSAAANYIIVIEKLH